MKAYPPTHTPRIYSFYFENFFLKINFILEELDLQKLGG